MTNEKEVNLQVLLQDDTEKYLKELSKEYPNHQEMMQELVQSHRTLLRMNSTEDASND